MILKLRRNWNVTAIPIDKLYQMLKKGNWHILRTRLVDDQVLMDVWRHC